jgi:molybdate transport system substrate-binding protein
MNSAMRAAALFLSAVLAHGLAGGAEVSVAVASNFTVPMRKLAAAFEQASGHKARLSFGSTGRFYAQVRNGAPFQVLLAADDETPARLEKEGLAVAGSRFTYATGRLVLWSASPGVVDERGEVLKKPGAGKLAIADPRLAPYGAAALETMRRLGVAQALQPRIVQGENISQAYQFVLTGNAQMGFVALSQVMLDGRIATGSAWRVPAGLHAPIRQDAVVLNAGKDNPAAAALVAFLRSDAARAVIRAHGYEI